MPEKEPRTYDDLRAINGGIGSVYDGAHHFHDRVLVPMHNRMDYRGLGRFARRYPEEFARLQRAMRFSAWRDLGSPGRFLDWEQEGRLTVYRGIGAGGKEAGASWTLDREVASGFAHYGPRLGWRVGQPKDPQARVMSRTVRPSDLVAYSNLQGEEEVVLDMDLGETIEAAVEALVGKPPARGQGWAEDPKTGAFFDPEDPGPKQRYVAYAAWGRPGDAEEIDLDASDKWRAKRLARAVLASDYYLPGGRLVRMQGPMHGLYY